MSALVERDTSSQVAQAAPANDAASFLQVIERASRDPSVDIDKMERLLQMHERMMNRQAETAFNAALSALQTELPEMPERGEIKNKAGGVQSKYALWEDVNEIIKPLLSKHGFALTFRTGNEGNKIIVTGVLSHAAGHSATSSFTLPVDMSGSKNEVQGLGSSTSYGKRYVAGALLNLTSRHEDNDGQGGRITALTDSQKADWKAAIDGMASVDESETLWAKIMQACAAVGDVAASAELRGAMTEKIRALRASKAST